MSRFLLIQLYPGGGGGGTIYCHNFHRCCLLIWYGRKIKYNRTVDEELVVITVAPLPSSPVRTLILELEVRLAE